MKTINDVLEEFSMSPDEFYQLISGAGTGGAFLYKGKSVGLYDYDGLANILMQDHSLSEDTVEDVMIAMTECDGKCPGCTEGNGAGCDAIAIFSMYQNCERK